MRFERARLILEREIALGNIPGAILEVGHKEGMISRFVVGNRSLLPEVAPLTEDTLFDMASCTKLMVTAAVTMKLVEQGELTLDDTMGRFYDDLPPEAAAISIQEILCHTSGIPPMKSCTAFSREEVAHEILKMPLAYPRGTAVGYACLGYIALGRILEDVTHQSLEELARTYFFEPMGMKNTGFDPQALGKPIAPTDIDYKTGSTRCGVVNDYNARAMGGMVGNAGLFSDIADTAIFARMMLNEGISDGKWILSRAAVRAMRQNRTAGLPSSGDYLSSRNRGLGTAICSLPDKPTSELLPLSAYGHNGFTGPTIIIDPEDEIYIVMLTSRLHTLKPWKNEAIGRIRRAVSNAVAAEL